MGLRATDEEEGDEEGEAIDKGSLSRIGGAEEVGISRTDVGNRWSGWEEERGMKYER